MHVAGVYVDDILLRAETEEECRRALKIAERLAASLGIPLNDKTVGPCGPDEGVTYLGAVIRTDSCMITVAEETRLYVMDRLKEVLTSRRLSLKSLESLCGVLTWVSFAFDRGRPRRNELYRALQQMAAKGARFIRPQGELLRQLQWWFHVLRKNEGLRSSFFDAQPDTPLCCSDASGDDGWGACAMGFHFVGPWPDEWRQSSGSDVPHMLYKELVAPALTTRFLAPFLRGKVACCALDNAGTAFAINALSARCDRSLILLREMADSCNEYRLGVIGGHAHRDNNTHTDDLSHALPRHVWKQVIHTAAVTKRHRVEFHFAAVDVATGECWLATTSVQQRRAGRDIEIVASDAAR